MVQKKHTTLILILFLLGIFMGAIDNGIVSPAREIIEQFFRIKRGRSLDDYNLHFGLCGFHAY